MYVKRQISISESYHDTNLWVDVVLHLCYYVGDIRTHDLLLISIISALQLRRSYNIIWASYHTSVVRNCGF